MHWKIGLIGFGNVGKAFIKLYSEMKDYWLEKYGLSASFYYIITSRGGVIKNESIDIEQLLSAARPTGRLDSFHGWKDGLTFSEAIHQSSINLLVEVSPTAIKNNGEPAATTIATALRSNISVATGNKAPFLFHYRELHELARKNNLLLGIGCTTGAALPSVNFGTYALAGSKITKIEGILNGVCNFILTRMEEKSISFDQALREAQARGIAETDPAYDIDGWDTAAKIIIISNTLIGTNLTLKSIAVEGIRNITPDLILQSRNAQKRIKLTGFTEIAGNIIRAGVSLKEFDSSSTLYNVMGTRKVIIYYTEPAGQFIVEGGASSPAGAAYSLWRDIINWHTQPQTR